jgi:hypothetical protein
MTDSEFKELAAIEIPTSAPKDNREYSDTHSATGTIVQDTRRRKIEMVEVVDEEEEESRQRPKSETLILELAMEETAGSPSQEEIPMKREVGKQQSSVVWQKSSGLTMDDYLVARGVARTARKERRKSQLLRSVLAQRNPREKLKKLFSPKRTV